MYESLMSTLDDCMAQLESSRLIADATRAELQRQGLLFAAFLSDLDAKRIEMEPSALEQNLEEIREFCSLISSNLTPKI